MHQKYINNDKGSNEEQKTFKQRYWYDWQWWKVTYIWSDDFKQDTKKDTSASCPKPIKETPMKSSRVRSQFRFKTVDHSDSDCQGHSHYCQKAIVYNNFIYSINWKKLIFSLCIITFLNSADLDNASSHFKTLHVWNFLFLLEFKNFWALRTCPRHVICLALCPQIRQWQKRMIPAKTIGFVMLHHLA